ncbi:MAG: excinuclease ABC subunit UvrC [Clostridia bacterium]|nr:excinuclease ABC subunit UvrC [Clostridia bacterium]
MTEKIKQLRQQAMALPLQPGVYIMKDERGTVIYIGKAKQLRNRVSQYFGSDTNHTEKVRRMVSCVDRFEYIVAGSEFEALVLECSLIKQYSPKYNILLKDDKGYRYIRVSPPPYSRITEVKQRADDGARYIGPYMSSFVLKQAVDEVNRLFQLSTCKKPLAYGKRLERPCLNHHIGQCCAPCSGRVKEADYAERVEQAVTYLTQGSAKLAVLLEKRMNEAAEALDFETAARLRDRIRALQKLGEKQKVVHSRVPRQDVIALAQAGDTACFEVFRFTAGALCDREEFLTEAVDDAPVARAEFLRRYYSLRESVPPRVALDGPVEDGELLEAWLSERAAAAGERYRVKLVFPQRGEQAQLLAMCRDNAAERVARQLEIGGRDVKALEELQQLLGLADTPHRIESYDISHQSGTDVVGAMVVFCDGRPSRRDYRRFAIRTVQGQDDTACLREVLDRRLREYAEQKDSGEGFGVLPDLILLDGGKPQLEAVKPLVDSFGYDIPVFGLVKDGHHRTRAITAAGGEIAIQGRRAAFTLASSIQEEVHRFAIGYHRQKRRRVIGSTLTGIPGVGEKRAALLLRYFGSVTAVRNADVEQLAAVKGMTRPAAEAIVSFFAEQQEE